jgi:hypothetical protein
MNENHGGYFLIIPQGVYTEKINPRSMLVFGVILSLANARNGWCYASNNYIGELLDVSGRTISDCIAELKKKRLIYVEVGKNNQTGNVYRRMKTYWTNEKTKILNFKVDPEIDAELDKLYKEMKA